MEFQLSYFMSSKMMLWKYCIQYANKFGKLSSGHKTGKGWFSFQSQRMQMPKNVQTTIQLHSFQFSSVVQLCPTLCNPMNRSTPGLLVHHQLPVHHQLKLMPIESVMPSSHLILCCPLLLLPLTPPSIRVFSNEPTFHMRWPKYWSFSFSISPSSEHPGLISFRMDWLDLLAVKGTLKNLLQQHSSKASFIC